jgi:hypothetical protein
MTRRASDMPEDEWLAYQQRLAETFERVDRINAGLAERTATVVEERWVAPETERAPEPTPVRPRQPVVIARDWPAEQKWVERVAGHKIEPLAKEIGAVCGQLERRIAELEDRLTKSEVAVTELLLEQERRLADLEQRAVMKPPPKPKLVGSDGAA